MKKLLFMLVAIMAMSTFSSCDIEEPDGKWDEMKWEKTSYEKEGYCIKVPKEGGTFTFKCKNYSHFWLNNIKETIPGYGIDKITNYYPDEKRYKKMECEVATVSVEENTLTITIAPSECSYRLIDLTVTAGDIFDVIKFVQ